MYSRFIGEVNKMAYIVYAKRSKPIKENFDVIDVEEIHHGILNGEHQAYSLYNLSPNGRNYRDGANIQLFPKRRIDTITTNNSNLITMSCSPFDFDRIKTLQAMKQWTQNAWLDAKRRWNNPTATLPESEVSKIAAKLWTIRTDNYGIPSKELNNTSQSKVKHSYTVSEEYRSSIDSEIDEILEHHGVKGMRWGVINEDDKKPRSSHGTGQHEGYISPNYHGRQNTGSISSSNNGQSVRSTNNKHGSSNKRGSSNRLSYYPEFGDEPLCTSSGCEILLKNTAVKNNNSSNGYSIGINEDAIRRTLEDDPDKLYGVIYDKVISQLKKFKIYMTNEQIEAIALKLTNAVNRNRRLWV